MNSKTAIALAIVAALATAPAYAKPKPIKGRYKCKGTAIETFNGLTITKKIKAKASTVNYFSDAAYSLSLDVLTRGHQISFFMHLPVGDDLTFQPGMDTLENWGYRSNACACIVDIDIGGHGLINKNKNGRKFTIDVTQEWHEWKNPSIHTDRYILNCKR